MTELEQAAQWINNSTTGCIAVLMDGHIMVQVPGILVHGGKRVQRIYSTERIYSLTGAIKLIQSME